MTADKTQIADELKRWSLQQLGLPPEEPATLSVVSGDASFRCYYRLSLPGDMHFIAVHAPPEKEDNPAFIAVQQRMMAANLRVPGMLGWDLERGFLLQEDFGDQLLLPCLNSIDAADRYYREAFTCLLNMQSMPLADGDLPDYDRARLLEEMALFPHWFVEQLLGHSLSDAEWQMLARLFDRLAARAEAQPQGFVHRDFHSRNIMLLNDGELGLIDFQDAVRGPLTYDVMSLLRDCYVHWPPASVKTWLLAYRQQLVAAGIAVPDEDAFLWDADWMGLQRHIKVLGIFARLKLRDGKSAYLDDLPLVMAYTLSVAEQYEDCCEFVVWFSDTLLPLARQQSWFREVSL
ncbi:MAG: aminoglycoside phosphotransferase family protein [Spongiibacter marinus]|uniref:aminoglycoside phosphotransferase family protein n=1 Tax=Spongiibacter TaxID=630749 RepID=UPI000C092A39|nr:phosphotransferase [Spongiibacter sp.]MAK43890.1 aminoglycoside phosphotransferase [Spongiibacter sp.]